MKKVLVAIFFAVLMPAVVVAQENAASSSNPVSDSVKRMVAQHAQGIIAGAEEMPADKYSYKPTAGQMTFGHFYWRDSYNIAQPEMISRFDAFAVKPHLAATQ